MNDKLSQFNTSAEIKWMTGWGSRIENPQVTHLSLCLDKVATRYNKWWQPLEFVRTNENLKITFSIGNQNQYIHCIQHATFFTDLPMSIACDTIETIRLTLKTTENHLQLLQLTMSEYIALINLLNMKQDKFYIPFQYLIFGKQVFFSCGATFVEFNIELTFNDNVHFSASVDSMCFTLGKEELIKKTLTQTLYFANKYLTKKYTTDESHDSFQLNYAQPIKSIVAFNYNVQNQLQVSVDHMQFHGSHTNKNIPHYLCEIDKSAYESLMSDTSQHMYLKTLGNKLHDGCDFMNDDCCNKILPTNKTIDVKSMCESSIGSISFLIQFVTHLCVDSEAHYQYCINCEKNHNPNSYPLTKQTLTKFVEGYWQRSTECGCCNEFKYPFPVDSGKSVDETFLQNLDNIKQRCKINSFFGASYCRLCGNENNGSDEFSFKVNGITYIFPSGITHYYTVHNVQPSSEFVNAVEQYLKTISNSAK